MHGAAGDVPERPPAVHQPVGGSGDDEAERAGGVDADQIPHRIDRACIPTESEAADDAESHEIRRQAGFGKNPDKAVSAR